MAPVVVDASVLGALWVEDPLSAAAVRALDALRSRGASLHAPDLVLLEAASAFRQRARRAELTVKEAKQALEGLMATGVELHPVAPLAPAALSLSLDTGVTPYDAAYLVLGVLLEAPLLTGDGDLRARALEAGLDAVSAGEVGEP